MRVQVRFGEHRRRRNAKHEWNQEVWWKAGERNFSTLLFFDRTLGSHAGLCVDVGGNVERARSAWTRPLTMTTLRAAVRAISVASLPRPRVAAAAPAARTGVTRPTSRFRGFPSLDKRRWATTPSSRRHRGFTVTARSALSAATATDLLADISDPHSFEVRDAPPSPALSQTVPSGHPPIFVPKRLRRRNRLSSRLI